MPERTPRPRARRVFRALETIHGMIYFAPQAQARYDALGLSGRMGYFASRSAAMGPVPAEVVIATFYNFEPEHVRGAIPAAWDIASPAQILDARHAGADEALRHALGDEIGSAEMKELAELLRPCALRACEQLEGRALFAAHAALPWPDEPHMVLWHAQTLLREYRGDAHVGLLMTHGLSGLEALITHAASGEVPAAALLSTRSWPQSAWDAALADLAQRGIVDAHGAFTPAGQSQRDEIEAETDARSAYAYAALTDDEAERIVQAGRRLSRLVIDAGLLRI